MRLTEPIVFVRLSFSLPGQQRQIANNAAAESVGAKASRVRTVAKLFASDAFEAIKSADGVARAELLRFAIRVEGSFSGSYILPRKMLGKAIEKLDGSKILRDSLVNDFLAGPYDAERTREEISHWRL